MVEILCNGKVHYRRPENHEDVEEVKMLISSGQAPSYAIRSDKCECDNTHEHNHTVCRYCWNIGIRYATAWWQGHNNALAAEANPREISAVLPATNVHK